MKCWSKGQAVALVFILALCGTAHAVGYSQPTFSRPHALLAQGNSGQSKWRIYAHLSREANASHRPCIDASIGKILSPPGQAPINSVCGEVSTLPNVVTATSTDTGRKQTVVAFAFGENVRVARVLIAGRGASLIRTRLLSRAKAQRTHLEKFRFGALVINGSFCIRRIQGLAGSKVLSDSGATSCEG